MNEQLQQLIDRIKQAQNILVAVSSNPSVDQLAAAIGLALTLNKQGKHATAVFSGQVPSTLEFLKPEDTLEKTTDSLRDFIIALDKSKADKLRYKVEDDVVRIFITPYRTSLTKDDLQFSQGDFNVDVVVCLGVTEQQDLDTAITSHGRILHDATVVAVSTVGQGSLGSINWVEPNSSSLSEMIVSLADGLDKKLMDNQIATALLTGIVASTERFSNDKTSPRTMSASAELMAAGANQQLIATQLNGVAAASPVTTEPTEAPAPVSDTTEEPAPQPPKAEPGMLEIDHEAEEAASEPETPAPEPPAQIHVDEDGQLVTATDPFPAISQVRSGGETTQTSPSASLGKRERVVMPPQADSAELTANATPEQPERASGELTLPAVPSPLLTHNENTQSSTPAFTLPTPPAPEPPQSAAPAWQPPAVPPVEPDETLAEIEQSVDSPHLRAEGLDGTASVEDARSAVEAALNHAPPAAPLPIDALGAQPLGSDLQQPTEPAGPAPFEAPQPAAPSQVLNTGFSEPTPGTSPADETLDMPLPSNPFGPGQQQAAPQFQNPLLPPAPSSPSSFPGAPQQSNGTPPPPPVPPPMLPPLQ